MAKFCTKCGKKLEEGKTCSCTKEKTTEAKVEVVTTSNANEIINSLIEIAKGIFVKPIDTIRKYTDDNNMILGLILIAINSLITGLMGCQFIKWRYCRYIVSIILISKVFVSEDSKP